MGYHCPKLRSDHLRLPCDLNISKLKELRKKFPNALLGPLEHCATCKGKELVVREALEGMSVVKPSAVSPENRQVIEQNGIIPPLTGQGPPLPDMAGNYDKGYEKLGGDVLDLATQNRSETLAPHLERKTAPGPELGFEAAVPLLSDNLNDFKDAAPLGTKGESMPQVQVQAPREMPAAVKGLIKGQFCKNHPEVEARKDKHGVYMGRCRACLAAAMARNRRKRGGKAADKTMTPAVARDLNKDKSPQLQSSQPGNRPGNIILVFPDKHLRLRDWVAAQAEYYERTPAAQVLYLLKRAMVTGLE